MANLLVVDDERDIRDLIVKRMVRAGHEVLAAGTAPAALELVERHGAPDGAILDVDLRDGMDGFALLDRLRESCPGLPALFLTVLWGDDVRARADAAGAGHLEKPFTAASLHDGVRRLLVPAAGNDP